MAHLDHGERLGADERLLGVGDMVAAQQFDRHVMPQGHGVDQRSVTVEDGGLDGHGGSLVTRAWHKQIP